MNIIERTIYTQERRYLIPIPYKQGSNAIQIKFTFADYEIPPGASAKVYVSKPSGSATYNTATISGNSVTINPTTEMFSESGICEMIAHITKDSTVLYSFGYPVDVEGNPLADRDGSEGSNQPDIIQQIIDRLNGLDPGGGSGTGGGSEEAREIQLQNSGTAIQWKYEGESSWHDLVQLAEITGKNGNDGVTPTIGENGNWYIGEEDTGKPSRGENGVTVDDNTNKITTTDAGRKSVHAMVSFIDDDCRSDVYTVLFPLIKSLDIPYTLACPTGSIGQSLYMTQAQLKEMYDYGVTISCHTVNQTNMDTVSREQLREILKQSLSDLKSWGIEDVRTYAYCQGKYTVDNIQVVKEFFDMGFLTDKGINQIPYESYYMRRVGLFPSTGNFTLAQAKEYVDQLSESGGWLIYMTHCYTDTFNSSELSELVTYIKDKNIDIVDVNEALEQTGNVIEAGHYKKNDLSSGHYFVVDSTGKMHTDSFAGSGSGGGESNGNETVTLNLNESYLIGKETSASYKGKLLPMTQTNKDHVVSDPVDVTDCTSVIITGWAYSGYGIYSFLGESGECVSAVWSSHSLAEGADTIDAQTVSVPEGAKTLIIAGHKDYVLPALVKIKTESGQNQNLLPLDGVKWVCIGDSLTEANSRTTKHYFDYIAERTGCEVVNMGESGSGYKKGEDSENAFYQRALNVPSDADVITIFGSGNDLSLTLGTADDTETTTICGCINKTIDNIYSAAPLARLFIISPTPWQSYNPANEGNAMDLYSDALKEICRKRGIQFLDLYHCSGLRPWDSSFRTLAYSKDDGNGVHPDENGHKIISWPIQSAVF